MAGAGKGVLRIAIEDFFTTTKIGKWLSGWYTDFIEDFEGGIVAQYNDALTEIAKIPELKKYFDPAQFKIGGGAHQGGAATLLGFGVNVGMGAASAFLAPLMRLINYAMDTKIHSGRFDPQQAIVVMFRNPNFDTLLREDMSQLGWDEARQGLMINALRPRPGNGELVSLFLRGKITQLTLSQELTRRGFEQEAIDGIFELANIIPGVGDLMSMANRMVWDDSIANRFGTDALLDPIVTQWAAKQGLSADWVKRFWRMHWSIPSPQTGMEMLHRLRPGRSKNPFTSEDMTMLLKIGDFPEYWFSRFLEISYNPYTRVDVRRMHKLGVITDDELYQTYLDLGYDEQHAKGLSDWTIKNETLTDKTKVEVARDLNQGTIVDAYQKKVIDRAKATAFLTQLKFDPQEVEVILKAAEFQKTVAVKSSIDVTYAAKLLSLVEQAYAARMLSQGEAQTMLAGLNYQADEIAFVLKYADFDYNNTVLNDALKLIGDAYTAGALDQNGVITLLGTYNISGQQQTQLFAEWDQTRKIRSKRLTQAQYLSAWLKGFITEADYRARLLDLGYADQDIEILIKLGTPPAGA
jgi:hypothetical protein